MEYVNIELNPLEKQEEALFLSLKRYLYEQYKENNLLLLYRGEKYTNIRRRLFKNDESDAPEAQIVFANAFYFGDKARHFDIDQFDPTQRNHLLNINDSSPETLTYLM